MKDNDYSGPWVPVVFVQGHEFYEIADMGIDEMVEYLAQWDYGQETDDAHTYSEAPWGAYDKLYHSGEYVLAVGDIYASLNRRPLN